MGNKKGLLETRIPRLITLLEDQGSFLMEESERLHLLEKTRAIAGRLAELGSRSLAIGLVGGTGVGKSTIMNSLAGETIAHTSHRRPDTDSVLVYRHSSSPPLPDAHAGGLKIKEILHDADAVKEILLCDLPDFDSLVKEHREQVTVFLEQLDMVVWVVSPEKYGDARFYDLLKTTLKSKTNFIFVLNKADLLFDGVSEAEGSSRLKALLEVLSGHLSGSGIEMPYILAVSARKPDANDPGDRWNQFQTFKGAVFRRRDEKQILAIKAANLEEELTAIVSAVEERSARILLLSEALKAFRQETARDISQWMEAGAAPVEELTERYLAARRAAAESADLSLAGWPGKIFALLGSKKEVSLLGTPSSFLPKEISDALQPLERQVEYLENRLYNSLKTLKGIAKGFDERLSEHIDRKGLMADINTRFTAILRDALSPRPPSRRRIFLAFQKLIYLAAFVLFLAALASGGSWEAFFTRPAAGPFFIALFSTLKSLFSASGLAALCAYILICLFLGLRFYIRARRYQAGEARAAGDAVKKELMRIWEGAFNEIGSRVMALEQRLNSEAEAASRIAQDTPR